MSLAFSKITAPLVASTISLSVYLLTLCPTVYLGDSGELSAAAFCLGVPHGSGYPLYVLVGKGFCLLPFGSVGFRVNLMSAVFGAMTVGLLFSLIRRMSGSLLGAWVGSGLFAFLSVFWWQTVAAEVYTLHVFFVVFMVWLLWRWEEDREFYLLVIFALVTGLSFGNHLQTVMLAPAVYYLILSGDRKMLLDGKRFLVLSVFFVLPLLVYLYLPVRTWAGAAIHWGDPDSWDRFWAHVSGRSHRGGYVFNLGVWGYAERLKESLGFVWEQFGVMVLVGMWGWWRIRVVRWRIFLLGVVFFDLFYTVFLNTISLEITPFNLSVCVVLAIGVGVGVGEAVKWCERRGVGVVQVVKVGCGVIPLMFLGLNYRASDQSPNYTAYEHALNIFRTTAPGDTLLVDGDNHFFPLVYSRLVERMREGTAVYDRLNLLFKLIPALRATNISGGEWVKARAEKEKTIMEHALQTDVFFAVFNPGSILLPPSYKVTDYCLLKRVMKKEEAEKPYRVPNLWRYYATESFYGAFTRDFMNRQIQAHFRLRYGQYLFASGNSRAGLQSVLDAAKIGFDDSGVHLMAASILINEELLQEAGDELDRASSLLGEGSAVLDNNWGCYFFRLKNYDAAIRFFRKAAEVSPETAMYHRNLALALQKAGKDIEAAHELDAFSSTHPYPGGLEDLGTEQLQESGTE